MKEVRPTSGRVLLALMSILGGAMDNLAFLDLFAGTGRVGLEALNRGASPVFFIETLRARAEAIKKIIPARHRDNANVLNLDIRRGLSWLEKKSAPFDIVFADPPYHEGWGSELPSIIESHISILKLDGIFIYEHAERENVSGFSKLKIKDVRNYGETALTFFENSE